MLTQRPCRIGIFAPRQVLVRASYVPDYSSPDPSNLNRGLGRGTPSKPSRVPSAKFWNYQAPPASIGSPDGYQLEPVGIPEYGAGDGGDGGSSGGGGRWGNGGGGSGGDPMKGFTYLFAFILFGAGVAAYLKKGSTTSLMVSSGAAGLLMVAASLMGHPSMRVGTFLALATCAALGGVMGKRAYTSGKIIPAGMVSGLSLLMCAGYIGVLLP